MSTSAEELWARLIAALRRQGRLPLGNERMTPAELAAQLAGAGGDSRVSRLVWDWYYPRRYGDQAGAMDDAEAETLFAALTGEVPRGAAQPGLHPHLQTSVVASCRICGRELAPEASVGK